MKVIYLVVWWSALKFNWDEIEINFSKFPIINHAELIKISFHFYVYKVIVTIFTPAEVFKEDCGLVLFVRKATLIKSTVWNV